MAREDVQGNKNLEIAILQRGHRSVSVVLSGELDVASAPELQDRLAWVASNGILHLVLDLAAVTFVGSVGISVFITAFKRMEAAGGSLVVRNAAPSVFRIFEITGLANILSVSSIKKETKAASDTSVRRFATPPFISSSPHRVA
jgi:anti-sigma B factor antagonist